jgi:hypothetical protein
MKLYGHRAAAVVSLLCTAYAGAPAAMAHDAKSKRIDAKLYEVTENMTLDNVMTPTLRTATAALQGTARLGTPLCPVDLVQALVSLGLLARGDKPCTITAVGSDIIDPRTGSGVLKDGAFSVVVNLDNKTDAPEFVVMTGEFGGDLQVVIDTSTTPPQALPLINLTNGKLTTKTVLGVPVQSIDQLNEGWHLSLDPKDFEPVPFTGVFRLPFTVERHIWRRAFSTREAFYLGDKGQLIKVQLDERSLGFPTVRVEIDF